MKSFKFNTSSQPSGPTSPRGNNNLGVSSSNATSPRLATGTTSSSSPKSSSGGAGGAAIPYDTDYRTLMVSGTPKYLAHLFDPGAGDPAAGGGDADYRYQASSVDIKLTYFPRWLPTANNWKNPIL